MVMAAGIAAHSYFSKIKDVGVIRKLMDVNFMGQVILLKHALNTLRQNNGQIVAISSVSGFIPLPQRAAYTASKAASDQFLLSLGLEEPNIRISIVIPDTFTGSSFRDNSLIKGTELENRKVSLTVEDVAN